LDQEIKIRLDDGSRALFTSQKGEALSREQVHRIFKGIAERAGVPKGKRFVHILKHSRASHLVDASLALINPCGLGSIRLARMRIDLDHLFVCTAPGALEAEELVRFGLREGPSNQHPGQGTANRRFASSNAMIEFLWVSDAQEAQSEGPRRTLLWERWSGREGETSPFGVTASKTHATFRNRRSGVHLGVNRD
jgi:hypothetical protein